MASPLLVAVDTGGTFTDVAVAGVTGGVLATLKEPTRPDDPAASVLAGIRRGLDTVGADPADVLRLVHGTTIATNLVLEGRGARVAYVGTAGFEQVPLIGREVRGGPAMFDLAFRKPDPLVRPTDVFGVGGRIDARGAELAPFDDEGARRAIDAIVTSGVGAVAVCFLHSYANAEHERRFGALITEREPSLTVVLSSDIWAEFREYDRSMTTIVSAYIAPKLAAYLGRLATDLRTLGITARLEVMQSGGGVCTAEVVLGRAVVALESGPAAGVLAAASTGARNGYPRVIAFDMGGTTAKAGTVIDGAPVVTREFSVGGHASTTAGGSSCGLPVRVPVIDLAEVGAGGGSIARVDEWGVVKVGPTSAGAQPGPACYGRGGELPTITDCDLVLGYLRGGSTFGGSVELSLELAQRAVETHLAQPLGVDVITAARGAVEVANASMASAIRLVTVERGVDPRTFVLLGSGGAGPSHLVALADDFGIGRVIVPRSAGVFSALGLLAADVVHEAVRTRRTRVDQVDVAALYADLGELDAEATATLLDQGIKPDAVEVLYEADLRYWHQGHEVPVPVPRTPPPELAPLLTDSFRRIYAERFGILSEDPVEIVNIRVRSIGATVKVEPSTVDEAVDGGAAPDRQVVHFVGGTGSHDCDVHPAGALGRGSEVVGPALVEDEHFTFAIPEGWRARMDETGNLVAIKPVATPTDTTRGNHR